MSHCPPCIDGGTELWCEPPSCACPGSPYACYHPVIYRKTYCYEGPNCDLVLYLSPVGCATQYVC